MNDFLFLRLDAPLMSFGGPVVDQEGPTREHPGRSMITGLLANALGWEHRDWDALQRLQESLRFAARRDRAPAQLSDFQTVDLGQPFLRQGWTTWGAVESRGGGSSGGTHIRYRSYLVNGVFTIALTIEDGPVSLGELEQALKEPARPLFLGRKPCIPSVPLFLQRTTARSPLDALRKLPPYGGEEARSFMAWWDDGEDEEGVQQSRLLSISDERDWSNRVHSGRRFLREGLVHYAEGDSQ